MTYKDLTTKQIFSGEVKYTLDDFVRDFKEQVEKDWGKERLYKENKNKTVFQGILITIAFASQKKPLKIISEFVLGSDNQEPLELTKYIIDMYAREIEVLEGLQMKMFLDNMKTYRLSDSLNLKMLNANFRTWLGKTLELKN
ncbi:hypothetical protein A3D00_03350 [Candidatus Woesebacteria bacterium RIFCSPHIGHO2_02_FULL_38_9]|uniref:Uncharacterized protein n=1 Tax=Candidatus Woesebacteria bacterium RIFCSPHIGHO2_01_FULL_39_28 TaxID=1802496 RepID=A0A1F7YFS9_9BACT|nr:MAG: hypothetical protein A2627_01555 [Candidatus Woesebacteria bacterium RIFCSPHIGHO2_01_FULL_39_28]OGM32271.1 MAG: hypothetical protein A3D00_03350 [Candidatus Woesebacteria bacterium RIFCSPHIGHO2_02_FULL_38_9]OGM56872.1 MAG: hypothetical protein A3A50_03940 [Candidatus Woesebacteria bacterium RIFCSPLOWO2_01_FULL_38_20]